KKKKPIMKISEKTDSSKSSSIASTKKPFFSAKPNEKSSDSFFSKAPEIIQRKETNLKQDQWKGSEIEFSLRGNWDGNVVTNRTLINLIQRLDNLIASNPNVFANPGITIKGYDTARVAAVAGLFSGIIPTQWIDPDFNRFGDSYRVDRIGLDYLKLGTLNRRGQRRLNNILQGFRSFVSN
ncbi:MAG: hypothetical protein MI974_07290, partial [Chitinophagales bacterium]|nr:hypothetical protein [Chitinophagales bacterium]